MKKLLFLVAMAVISQTAFAQAPTDTIKIADETEMMITKSNKTLIISSNETVSNMIIKTYKSCECMKYTFTYKKDRNGKYPEYRFTFPIEVYEKLKSNPKFKA